MPSIRVFSENPFSYCDSEIPLTITGLDGYMATTPPGDVAMILFKILLKPLLSLRYRVRVLGLEHVQLGFASNRKA